MSIGSLLLGATVLVLVGLFLARPFLRSNARYGRQMSQRQELVAQKEAVLAQIQVLEFDFETGTLPEADYQQQRQELVAKAAEILKQLDDLPREATAKPARGVEREIEAAVAQLRQRQARRAIPVPAAVTSKPPIPAPAVDEKTGTENGRVKFCSQCGQPVEEQDNFCAYCGHKIVLPQTT